jgi:DNA-binding transcriptional LysR family regulator
MSFTLRQIKHAESLARHRNFREAAVELSISQPALTRSIKSLEAILGGQLFDRLSVGVEPTGAGLVFLEKARQLLMDSRELRREVEATLGLTLGSLCVAVGPYPGEYLVPEAMARIIGQYPELTYRISEMDWSEIPDSLLNRNVDIAVADISSVDDDPRFDTELLMDDPLFYVCGRDHPLANRSNVGLSEIRSYPLVANSVPPRMAKFLTNPGPSGSIRRDTGLFEPRVEVTTFSATKRVLFSSNAVTCTPILQVEPELTNGSLALIHTEPVPLRMNSGFIYLAGRTLSAAAIRYMEEVRAIKLTMDRRSAEFEKQFLSYRDETREVL